MNISDIDNECFGCGACVSVCPQSCISLIPDKEGFLYPKIDSSKCIECGSCAKVCSFIDIKKNKNLIAYYAAKTNDDEKRLNSSSGGMFFELAKTIISNGGTVWGARFNEDWEVFHDCASTIEGLQPLAKAKYVQSNISHVYCKIKEKLALGDNILFTGTPCQILALKKYLQKEHNNLYTVDIACHGVPSPLVWQEYLKTLSGGKRIDNINFREKVPTWESYSICYTIDGVLKRNLHDFDPYMLGYLEGLYTRPTCHNCPVKPNCYASDISIADFWGISNIDPTMNDHRGTSLVIIRTGKGKQLFDQTNVTSKEYSIQQVEQYNQSFTHISKSSPLRNRFWEDTRKNGIGQTVILYGKILRPSWTIRMKIALYNFFFK